MQTNDFSLTGEEIAGLAQRAADEGYEYLFSVVVPVYNVQDYIEEAVRSLEGQTVGFEHVQVVLVNDGSADGSLQKCREIASRHPENVVVLDREHAGASAARNAGLAQVRGKYVNFLDADDAWSEDAFMCATAFFEQHPEVQVVAAKMMYFDAKEGDHRLNYKFEESRAIDLQQAVDCPQVSASSCFFTASSIEGMRFNESVQVSEGMLFVNELLLKELKYGAMSQPTYRCRQRKLKDSVSDTMKDNRSWYLDTVQACYRHLCDQSALMYGKVLPFVQFAIMYDLQWRIRAAAPSVLDSGEIDAYKQAIVSLLGEIDDDVICDQRTITIDYVAYAMALKYGVAFGDLLSSLELDGTRFAAHINGASDQLVVANLRDIDTLSDRLMVESCAFEGDSLELRGYIATFRFKPADVSLVLNVNGAPIVADVFETESRKLRNPFGDETPGKTGFSCSIPLVRNAEVHIAVDMQLFGQASRPMRFSFAEGNALPERLHEGFYAVEGDLLWRVMSPRDVVVRRLDDCNEAARGELEERLAQYGDVMQHVPREPYERAEWRL